MYPSLNDLLRKVSMQILDHEIQEKHINFSCLKHLQCQSRQLMHCDTLKQDNDSTVRGDGGSRVGEVRAGTTSPMPEHKGFKLQ